MSLLLLFRGSYSSSATISEDYMVDNIVLDTSISVNGWHVGRQADASITSTRGWTESRNTRSPWPRKKYKIPFKVLTAAQRSYLSNFFEARNGSVRAFLLWDLDSCYVSGQTIGTGDGATISFQMVLTRGDSAHSYNKPILHPVPAGTTVPYEIRSVVNGATTATLNVYVQGVLKTLTTDYTINYTTGVITFTSAVPNGHIITATFMWYTPVRFTTDDFNIALHSLYGETDGDLIEVFE